jgi:hypothetical protein
MAAIGCLWNSQGLAPLAGLAEKDPLLRGLLEWRLSVASVKANLPRLPQTRAITVHYEELLADPVTTYVRIEQFADLPPHPEPRNFAARTIKRRSPEASGTDLPPPALQIARDLL